MTNIFNDQVDQLLRKAEQRLRRDATSVVAAPSALEVKTATESPSSEDASCQPPLTIRDASQSQSNTAKQTQDTAGPNWFNLPKTQMTAEFKRDWQMLRIRGVLDPKHQKKALRASAPQYSQVGEIVAGPTEFFSARMSRKERKQTILEEVMSNHNDAKFKAKYAGIQKQKSSGKKDFYKKLVAQRRKRN